VDTQLDISYQDIAKSMKDLETFYHMMNNNGKFVTFFMSSELRYRVVLRSIEKTLPSVHLYKNK
jgi:hypothetical protein